MLKLSKASVFAAASCDAAPVSTLRGRQTGVPRTLDIPAPFPYPLARGKRTRLLQASRNAYTSHYLQKNRYLAVKVFLFMYSFSV